MGNFYIKRRLVRISIDNFIELPYYDKVNEASVNAKNTINILVNLNFLKSQKRFLSFVLLLSYLFFILTSVHK